MTLALSARDEPAPIDPVVVDLMTIRVLSRTVMRRVQPLWLQDHGWSGRHPKSECYEGHGRPF